MEQRTQLLDQILESVAPALSDAVERVLREAREKQEEEFQKRLETAVREAEQGALLTAQERQQQAVAEAREQVRSQITSELLAEHEKALGQAKQELKAQFEERTESAQAFWAVEQARLQEQIKLWRAFADAQRDLGESVSQSDMLRRFVNLVDPFAASLAVYVMKADGLALWKTRGSSAFPDLVSKDTIDPDSYFKPVVVREKTVAAICAHAPYSAGPLDFLVASLARAIEVFGMRLQSPAPRSQPVEVEHDR